MFIGHVAVGFASKRLAPKASLGWLVLAPMFADVLWPVFVLVGLEEVRIDPGNTAVTPLDFVSYPWSHSLLLDVWWAAILAGAYWMKGNDLRGTLVIGAGVVSHWVMDAVAHRPDIPIAPGLATKVGLGLWRSLPLTMIVESVLFAGSVLFYVRATHPTKGSGRWGLAVYVAVLFAVYLAAILGPTPPSVSAVTASALLLIVVLIPLAHWVDRGREIGPA